MNLNLIGVTLSQLDRVTEVIKTKTAQAGRPITCKGAGCFHCCKEPANTYRKEVAYAIHHLHGDALERVKKRTEQWAKGFVDSHMNELPVPPVVEFRRHNLWCPLLENNQCMVYDRRPACCRLHMAVGPIENCEDDERRQEQLFATEPEPVIRSNLELAIACRPAIVNHLGVWLADLLLKQKIPSAAAYHADDKVDYMKERGEVAVMGAVGDYIKHIKETSRLTYREDETTG